jgi:hypothetical protein
MSDFPNGWDHAQVRGVLEHYENQSEDQALEEDERRVEDAGTSKKLREASGDEE